MRKETVNILAVDDKAANLIALESILKSPHIKLTTANSGNEALACLLDNEYACILLDVKMPDINGLEIAEIIRNDERTKYLPILFVSGHNVGDVDIFKGYQLGAVDYLIKPLNADLVRCKVNVFADLHRKELDRRRAHEELRKAKEDLERRVEERTRELQDSNRKLKAHTEELIRSNRELEQFAFVSSHDLKEPLRNISMYVQLLEQKLTLPVDPTVQQYFDFVVEAANRMQHLINDLLAYSRVGKEEDTVQRNDPQQLIGIALENLKEEFEESHANIKMGSLPPIYGRQAQFVLLFQNLIANAIKFKSDKPLSITVDGDETEDEIHIAIRDNGIGIEPTYQTKVFELFQRLHTREEYPGTGIGLAVCKKIVDLHGGRIWIESSAGQGSTFHFSVPKETRSQ